MSDYDDISRLRRSVFMAIREGRKFTFVPSVFPPLFFPFLFFFAQKWKQKEKTFESSLQFTKKKNMASMQ